MGQPLFLMICPISIYHRLQPVPKGYTDKHFYMLSDVVHSLMWPFIVTTKFIFSTHLTLNTIKGKTSLNRWTKCFLRMEKQSRKLSQTVNFEWDVDEKSWAGMRFPRKNNQPPFLRTAVAEEKKHTRYILAESKNHKTSLKSVSWFHTKPKSLAI